MSRPRSAGSPRPLRVVDVMDGCSLKGHPWGPRTGSPSTLTLPCTGGQGPFRSPRYVQRSAGPPLKPLRGSASPGRTVRCQGRGLGVVLVDQEGSDSPEFGRGGFRVPEFESVLPTPIPGVRSVPSSHGASVTVPMSRCSCSCAPLWQVRLRRRPLGPGRYGPRTPSWCVPFSPNGRLLYPLNED